VSHDLRGKSLREDGISDEMNFHLPQSVEATVEAETLMRAEVHIVTGQKNAPVCGIIQDGPVGCYLLTNTWLECDESLKYTMVPTKHFYLVMDEAKIPKEFVADMLLRAKRFYGEYIRVKNGVAKIKTEEIPGKLMLSILFPPDLNYLKRTGTNQEFPNVKITEGIIEPDSGPLCKKIIGASPNSVVHILWKEFSPRTCLRFLSDTQQVIYYWLCHHGFTISISDCVTDSKEVVAKTVAEMDAQVSEILGRCNNNPSPHEEMQIMAVLNSAMNIGLQFSKESIAKGERNALHIMRASGAKGSFINLLQIAAFVGQQNIKGRRILHTISEGTRTLPHYLPGDKSAEAQGFVRHSYIDGLTAQEAFFHSAGGRVGLMATATGTATTGYITKRIVKKTEDSSVRHDGSVRDCNGRIVQFLYGDDGMDPKKLYYNREIEHPFFINAFNVSNRLNTQARREGQVTKKDKPIPLTDGMIDMILTHISAGPPNMRTEVLDMATANCHETLRKVLTNVKLYPCRIPRFCAEVRNYYETSKAQAGDMVGLLASNSIGEPSTQMSITGDTFVTVRIHGKQLTTTMKDLKEKIYAEQANRIKYLFDGSSDYIPNPYGMEIQSVHPITGKIAWRQVDEISSHPANGGVVTVITDSGKVVTTTLSHSHLRRSKSGVIKPIVAGNLKLGDYIPVEKKGFVVPYPLSVPNIDPSIVGFDNSACIREDGSVTMESIETLYKIDGNEYFERILNADIVWDRIVALKTQSSYVERVYDFTVNGYQTFKISNGIFVHNTLNVFHLAGVGGKDVSLGIPRLNELLNTTRSDSQKKPSGTIYFDDQDIKQRGDILKTLDEEEKANKVTETVIKLNHMRKTYLEITLKDVVSSYEMQYIEEEGVAYEDIVSPVNLLQYKAYVRPWWLDLLINLSKVPVPTDEGWVFVAKLDRSALYNYRLTVKDIATNLNESSEEKFYAYASPTVQSEIHIFTQSTFLRDYAMKELSKIIANFELITEQNTDFFIMRDVLTPILLNSVVSGIKGVSDARVRLEEGNEWVIDIKLAKCTAIAASKRFLNILTSPNVDPYRTIVDDMHAIRTTLGIEAARTFLIEEFNRIMSFDGTYVNFRHIEILVDCMTISGEITPVNRGGISRDVGPIAKLVFEETLKNGMESAAFGEHDSLRGLSASIMYGNQARLGTGTAKVMPADKLPAKRTKLTTVPVKKKQTAKSFDI
jgi:DNA-directed RNA polymerase beta' subunit